MISQAGSGPKSCRKAVLFLLPATIAIFLILLFPILYGIAMGFTDRLFPYDSYSVTGFRNFREIFRDPLFYRSLSNTVRMVFWSVAGTTLTGFALALLLRSGGKTAGFFRVIYFLPWVLPSTVVAFSFRWLYNDFYGLLNHWLVERGFLSAAVNPLARQDLVWPAVILPGIWFAYPFVMLVMASALRSIDPCIYEAARMDGAGSFRIFREVTLPSVGPTLVMLIILQIIWEAASFDLIYLLTKGGPANATLTLSLYIYRRAFENKQIGYASALAIILFLIILIFLGMYLSFARKGREESHEN